MYGLAWRLRAGHLVNTGHYSRVRHKAELDYQAERAGKIGLVHPTPEYIIERYRRCRLWRLFPKEFVFKCLRDGGLAGKHILDFGCGEGEITTQLARLGARVTGIDISPELVEIARKRAHLDGISDATDFVIGDIRRLAIPNDKFDVLISHAALHHVDFHSIVPRLIAWLKPGGMTVIVEPIAFSPAFQKIRDRLPIGKYASPDEGQLNQSAIDFVTHFLVDVRITHFNLFGRVTRFFPNANKIDKGHPLTKGALIAINGLDRLVLGLFPFLGKFSGTVVIVGRRGMCRS